MIFKNYGKQGMGGYNYEFHTSGFHIVDRVIVEIMDQPQKDRATDDVEAYFYQMVAGQSYGYYEPLTPEQTALNNYLTSIKAGKKISMYAWGLLHGFLIGSS